MADDGGNDLDEHPHIPNSLELLHQKYAAKEGGPDLTKSDPGITRNTTLDIGLTDGDSEKPPSEGANSNLVELEEKSESDEPESGRQSTRSILIEAAEKGDLGTVKNVLNTTGNKVNPDTKTKYQARSALHLACGYGQYDVVENLLQVGADPMQYSNSGRTPLHEACQGGHADVLTILLEYTCEVDTQDRDGQTPAHIAALNGEVDCIKLLYDKDASLVIEDKTGRQPAHLAAIRNHRPVLEYLYDVGVDLECPDEMGKLPVHHAAQHGALSCLTCLIERDSDITIGDAMGNLPMHYAAWHDQLDCMRFLVKQGSLIDFMNVEQKTSVHVAAQHGGVNVLHWLLEKGANPNAKDVHGNTAAHYASQTGKPQCYNCLLNHGIDIRSKNNKGDDTLDWAKKHGHSLRIEKAMKSEVPCPQCKKVQDHERWKDKFKPSPVLMSVSELREQAYVSPVPKLQQVPSQAQKNAEKRQKQQQKAKKSQAQGSKNVHASGAAGTTYPGPGAMSQGSKTKGKLPKRDLPTKYFGEYVEINDLYKFKI